MSLKPLETYESRCIKACEGIKKPEVIGRVIEYLEDGCAWREGWGVCGVFDNPWGAVVCRKLLHDLGFDIKDMYFKATGKKAGTIKEGTTYGQ